MLRHYNSTQTSRCLRKLTIIGDSTARQVFWAVADKLNSKNKVSTGNFELSPQIAKHTNMTLETGAGKDLRFLWDPYLNHTKMSAFPEYRDRLLVITSGLWHARHLDDRYLDDLEQQITHLLADSDYIRSPNRTLVQPQPPAVKRPIFLPIASPVQAKLDSDRAATLNPERTRAINARLRSLEASHGFEVMWATLPMTNGHNRAFDAQGLHLSDVIASQQLEILLNRMCNSGIGGAAHYCCSERVSDTPLHSYILALAVAIVLGWMLRLLGRRIWGTTAAQSKPACAGVAFAAAGLYCYLADRTALFQRVGKLIDVRLFVLLCIFSLLLGLATSTRVVPRGTGIEKDSSLAIAECLPRQQTDEWKGWMQIIILLYHYFGMSRVMWVYRMVRLLVASYLFLTGYGHTRYFINTNDFSFQRVVSVLVRLNLLSCVLPFFMGTTYDFYYFPALSSLWFVVTWLTIPRLSMRTVDLRLSAIRIAVSLIVMEFLLRSNGLQTGIFAALRSYKMVSVDQHEFPFRMRLDRLVPFLGILTALLQHRYRHHSLPDIHWLSERRIGKEAIMASSATLVLVVYLTWSQRFQTKASFNALHPFTAPLPIIAYVAVRNAANGLRNGYSRLFAWFGRHSLETYILQYHIWLAADTKGLLRLGILDGWLWYGETTIGSKAFWAEAAIITIIFLWVSSAVSNATVVLTKWIVAPNDTHVKGVPGELDHHNSVERTHFSWRPLRSRLHMKLGMRSKLFILLLVLWQLNLMW